MAIAYLAVQRVIFVQYKYTSKFLYAKIVFKGAVKVRGGAVQVRKIASLKLASAATRPSKCFLALSFRAVYYLNGVLVFLIV